MSRPKLTLEDIKQIRASLKSQNQLAKEYGVDRSTISRIRNRDRSYKNLEAWKTEQ